MVVDEAEVLAVDVAEDEWPTRPRRTRAPWQSGSAASRRPRLCRQDRVVTDVGSRMHPVEQIRVATGSQLHVSSCLRVVGTSMHHTRRVENN